MRLGFIGAGEEVPSTRALAMELQVNPNTVQKAYEELVRKGVLLSRRGQGKVVAGRGGESAVKQSENSIRAAFLKGVQIARAANLNDRRISELLNEVLKSNPKRARA